ncbi:hypothetical protein [Mycolicibacterium peregrinum]|nr:hypothetical protein [Mycolicibacterium peregrinum]
MLIDEKMTIVLRDISGVDMPIVFVHGVGTRAGDAYSKAVNARTALIHSFLLRPLGLDPRAVSFWNPYWGGNAAAFAWNYASLPGDREEKFGPSEALLALLLGEVWEGELPASDQVVLEVARRSMTDAVDLLWAVAAERVDEAAEVGELADLAVRATSLARAEPAPPWLNTIKSDKEFLNRLSKELTPVAPAATEESFGGPNRAFLRIREGLGRIQGAAGRLAGSVAVDLLRPSVNRSVSTFLGDIFVYLRQRESLGANAAIAKCVADGLEQAASARNADDSQLVVIAHSMGGNITYDLLSKLRTDLSCDVLVTVGSQVGVFAELGLFESVKPPTNPATDRVPKLPNVGRWINVFDPNDILGFATEGIFDGVKDYQYSTGKGAFAAHSTYFVRPSFYDRLAAHLNEAV